MIWLLLSPAFVALAIGLLNAHTWPRGRPRARWPGRVSVLIPARNEVANIARCVHAAAWSYPHEILVYDDGSTDGTAGVLAGLDIPALRVLHGTPLPEGWVGKAHACQRLGQAATGDLLLFVDADVTLEHLDMLLSLFDGADVVTAVPRQVTGSPFEHLVLPLLHLTYVSWLPLALIPRTRDPRVLAANGQVLAVRRSVWDAMGGFSDVRAAVVDDMAFCRRAKDLGATVVFADGHEIASCRMYDGAAEVWRGFSKNLFEGLGARTWRLAAVVALYLAAFVAPYAVLAIGVVAMPAWVLPGAAAVIANLVLRTVLAARHGHRWWSVLLHPVAVLALVGIAVNSWRWTRAGRIAWRGRVYGTLAEREAGHG